MRVPAEFVKFPGEVLGIPGFPWVPGGGLWGRSRGFRGSSWKFWEVPGTDSGGFREFWDGSGFYIHPLCSNYRLPEVILQVFARFGKISGRVWSSHGLYTHGETKLTLIFSRMEHKPTQLHVYNPWPKNLFLKTNISRLEKLHSCVHTRTLEFPALWRLHSFKRFGGNFVTNASVASSSPRLIFIEVMQWFQADESLIM